MKGNRNRRIFIIVFLLFTTFVAILAIDMAQRTTAPWNRPKQLERALPGSLPTQIDSLVRDTLTVE